MGYTGKLRVTNKFLALLLILITQLCVYGKDRRFEVQKAGSEITTGTVLNIVDQEINITDKYSVSNNTFIELRINDNIGPFSKYRYKVELSVIPKSSTGAALTLEAFTTTLTVENDRYTSAEFIDFVSYQIPARYGATVTVNTITIEDLSGAGISTTVTPANVSITLAFESERYYSPYNMALPVVITPVFVNGNSTIRLSWGQIAGAEEYELEWIWKDNYNTTGGILTAAEVTLTEREFESSNTRVETSQTSYDITLVYKSGYLAYRVRPIGRWLDNTSKRYYGPWSTFPSQEKTKFSDWSNAYVTVPEHDGSKNWQLEISYAEEGKKKEVVSYFDGSLRNRQTVTRSNTDKKAIIGETIYDNQGRPAIEVLPVPHHLSENTLKHYKDFNKNMSDLVYSQLDFDWDLKNVTQCEPALSGMLNTSGASRYYSPSGNSLLNNWQDFIPVANNLPFSQTEYTPDNTGRIQRKGGVGAAYQLGTGHETKYFYSVPTQNELNRLFGYRVGNVSHYKKNAVVDPNNQISISYMDPQGRTIATALVGESPTSLTGLLDQGVFANTTTDLLNKVNETDADTLLDNNILGTGNFGNVNDRLTFASQILVIKNNTLYDFIYGLKSKKAFTFGCLSASQGYPYVYNVKLNVTDNCGNSLAGTGGFDKVGVENVNLEALTPDLAYNKSFNAILNVGTYNVSKEIIVDPAILELYVTDYINRAKEIQGCFPDNLSPRATKAGCFTCDECVLSLGTQQAYINEMTAQHPGYVQMLPAEKTLVNQRYAREWTLLVEACQAPCKVPGVSYTTTVIGEIQDGTATDSQLALLVNDMSPTGQYGMTHTQIAENGSTSEVTETELNVFDANNQLYVPQYININNHHWKNPQHYRYNSNPNHYFEPDGSISYIYVKNNGDGTYTPPVDAGVALLPSDIDGFNLAEPHWLQNNQDIRPRWKESWGESLIKYHPEYAYFEYAGAVGALTKNISLYNGTSTLQNGVVNSEGYDTYLQSVTTAQAAITANLLDSATSIFTKDPFFPAQNGLNTDIEPSALYDIKKQIMNLATGHFQGQTGFDGLNLTMLQLAYMSTMCNSLEDCTIESGLTNPFIIQRLLDTNVNAEVPLDKKNEIWTRYVGYYISFKQRLNYVFSNVYAKRRGVYNGCIGGEEGDIFAVIDKYPAQVTQINDYLNGNVPASTLCGSAAATHYFDKEKRFIPIDILYDSAQSDSQIIQNLEAQTDYGYFIETGICPMGRDLEIFLNGLVQRKNAQGSPVSLVGSVLYNGHTFSRGLFQDLGGIAPSATPVSIQGTIVTPGSLNILAVQQGSVISPIQLNIASSDQVAYGYTWSNYLTSWHITEVSMFNYVGYNPATGLFHFEILVKVTQQNNQTNEIVLTGSTKARIGNCTIGEEPGNTIGEVLDDMSNQDCDIKDKFQHAMKQLLIALSASGNINSTNFNLASFQAYTGGYLPSYFGSQFAYSVTYSKIGNWGTIKVNGDTRFEIQLPNFPMNILVNFSIGSLNPSTNSHTANIGYIINMGFSYFPINTTSSVRRNSTKPLDFSCCTKPNNNDIVIYTPLCNAINCEQAYTQLLTYLYQSGHFFDANYTLTNDQNFINNTCVDEFFALTPGDVLIWRSPYSGSYQLSLNNTEVMFFSVDAANNIPSSGINSFTAMTLSYDVSTITFKNQQGQFTTITARKSYFRCDLALCSEIDADRNALGDDCEECNTLLDFDCDGILNNADNCPNVYNPSQQNSDGDNMGDACDVQAPPLTCDIEDFSNQRNTFTGRLKEVLNAIIASNGPSNQLVPFNHPTVQTFIGDCDLKHRFQARLAFLFLNGNLAGGCMDQFQLELDNFYYYKENNSITLKWIENPETNVYSQFKISFPSSTIGQINNIELINYIAPEQPNVLLYLTNSTIVGTLSHTIGVEAVYLPDSSETCGGYWSPNYSFCYFFDLSNQILPELNAVNVDNNNSLIAETDLIIMEGSEDLNMKVIVGDIKGPSVVVGTLKTKEPCDCIPQTITPVTWKNKYELYNSKLTLVTGYNASAYAALLTAEYFHTGNYAYITDAYLYYLQVFAIGSIDHPKFKLISEFGTTELNYGYNNYQAVINAYAAHLSGTVPAVKLSWAQFVSTYMRANKICPPRPLPLTMPVVTDPNKDCQEFFITINEAYDQAAFSAYIEAKKDEFRKAYLNSALINLKETYTMLYADKEYQYTLYYYDQAGNLTQTVPPQGVSRINTPASFPLINVARTANTENTTLLPQHKLKTNYEYNSLNQLIKQITPDGGETRFAYDALGRIIASQNAGQRTGNGSTANIRFSYTRYDELGRIIEAGQFKPASNIYSINDRGRLIITSSGAAVPLNGTTPYPYNISSLTEEVSYTVYDKYNINVAFTIGGGLASSGNGYLFNTDNRVAIIYYYDTKTVPGFQDETYNNYIAYDYDIHGNVREMVQYNSLIKNHIVGSRSSSYTQKRVNYEYDLISGNVNKVILQKDLADQFIHRYNYDADNRITSVQTSRDNVIWENDAKYYYYEHGPLARVVIGDKEVQGTDYAYTLQGWLKAVNSENMASANYDMGRDGRTGTGGNPLVAKDAFGYSLTYYKGTAGTAADMDYVQRNTGSTIPTPLAISGIAAVQSVANPNLYNGNIKRMVTSVRNTVEQVQPAQVNFYNYDQLNRIVGMEGRQFSSTLGSSADISSAYTYDNNGNIKTLKRNAPGNVAMDDLTYGYYGTTAVPTNRLQRIRETIAATAFANVDLDDQATTNNYVYDAIGQLTQDVSEGITGIAWRADGKVKSITKTGQPVITFQYDGLGNRISKTFGDITTQYVPDAQGNTLGVYDLVSSLNSSSQTVKNYYLKEHHIFGSSRLGMEEKEQLLATYAPAGGPIILEPAEPFNPTRGRGSYSRLVGDKRYELSNHLGNVLGVVTDRKLVDTGNSTVVSQNFNNISNGSAPANPSWFPTNATETPTVLNGRLQVYTITSASFGASAQQSLLAGRTYAIELNIDPAGASYPITYSIKNPAGTVVAQQVVTQAGLYTLYVTTTTAGAYTVGTFMSVPANTFLRRITYYIDDFKVMLLQQDATIGFASLFKPDVVVRNEYYPFGMLVPRPGVTTNTSDYRYGFNGKEMYNEVLGEGNFQDYGMRMYNPRIGRFINIDPLAKQYPELTPYQFASDSPISGIDLDGLEYYFASNGSYIGVGSPSSKVVRIIDVNVAESYKNKIEDIHKVATSDASKYYTIPKYKYNESNKTVETESMEIDDLLDYSHIVFGEGRGGQAKEFAHAILNGEIKTALRIQKLKTTNFGWKVPHSRENSREIRQYEDVGSGKDIVSLNILSIGLPRSWATTSGILHNGDKAFEVNKQNVIQKNKDGSPQINGNYAEFFKSKGNIPALLKIKGVQNIIKSMIEARTTKQTDPCPNCDSWKGGNNTNTFYNGRGGNSEIQKKS